MALESLDSGRFGHQLLCQPESTLAGVIGRDRLFRMRLGERFVAGADDDFDYALVDEDE